MSITTISRNFATQYLYWGTGLDDSNVSAVRGFTMTLIQNFSIFVSPARCVLSMLYPTNRAMLLQRGQLDPSNSMEQTSMCCGCSNFVSKMCWQFTWSRQKKKTTFFHKFVPLSPWVILWEHVSITHDSMNIWVFLIIYWEDRFYCVFQSLAVLEHAQNAHSLHVTLGYYRLAYTSESLPSKTDSPFIDLRNTVWKKRTYPGSMRIPCDDPDLWHARTRSLPVGARSKYFPKWNISVRPFRGTSKYESNSHAHPTDRDTCCLVKENSTPQFECSKFSLPCDPAIVLRLTCAEQTHIF